MPSTPINVGLFAASPVYYQVPLYQRLAAQPGISFRAIFGSSGGIRPVDAGFGQPVQWDLNLLEGYDSTFVRHAGSNPMGNGFWGQRAADLLPIVLNSKFDVLWVHGYNSAAHVLAAAAQRARGGVLLFREEQTGLHERPRAKRAVRKAGLQLFTRGQRVLYIGTENRKWLEGLGVPADHLYFAPYCVDNERLQREREDLLPHRAELRRQFGIRDQSGPVILTLSRLIQKKRPASVLRAFARVRATQPCTLLIAGSGAEEARLRTLVHEQKIPDVVFAGFLQQSEIGRAYSAADVFVLFSKEHETWGLVVNEAMNFGLPVVVSDKVGSGYDLVRQGENGFVVKWDDEGALAGVLENLVRNRELRIELGSRGTDLISDWNYDATFSGIMTGINDAVGSARSSRSRRHAP
jgi:glycosyltransferase involved in cell wall biosynthesis